MHQSGSTITPRDRRAPYRPTDSPSSAAQKRTRGVDHDNAWSVTCVVTDTFMTSGVERPAEDESMVHFVAM
jgi:hypothetical protein